ncbi:hypothetical protein GCM10009850_027350 [Nonomuraea monospora]|uniref:RES domain-containing protein n=1 Tax=Nonomuraea monospora TaxID=568818 RepID=A0ABN3CEY6_9ACTN
MPNTAPPRLYRAIPQLYLLPAGTSLWRVHLRCYKATDFNPRESTGEPRRTDANFGGGRFDGTDRDPYPSYYAGLAAETALAETLLRDLPFNDRGYRIIPRVLVRERRASVVVNTEDLILVDLLSGVAWAAVAQDGWLVHADPRDYHATRRWASWIREQEPRAQGLIWPSKREGGEPSVVLFGDRCPAGCLTPDSFGRDLDDLEGADWVNERLAPYRAHLTRPRRAAAWAAKE